MVEPELEGDLAHRQIGRCQLLFCHFHESLMNVLLGGLPRQGLEQVAGVVGRDVQFLGHRMHRREAVTSHLVPFKYPVSQSSKRSRILWLVILRVRNCWW